MYTSQDFPTKKALRSALKIRPVALQAPFIGSIPLNGTVYIEGPHGVHKWYAVGTTDSEGRLIKIK